MEIVLKILLLLGLVVVNGFFVAAEFALVKIRDTQLDTLVAKGHRRAKVARHIISNLNSFLSATQLGITMASLGLGWVGEPLSYQMLSPLLLSLGVESDSARHSISFAFGFSALTFLHISAGELAPKWTAIQRPLHISLWVALPLKWFYLASYPFNRLLNWAAGWLLRRVGIKQVSEAKQGHSEEELRLLLGTAQSRAGATTLGRDIVLNALDLRLRVAREVMRPRKEIVALDTEASMTECLEVAEKSRYSRFPLSDGGDLDKTLGVIHIKDLYAMRLKAKRGWDLLPVARKLIYVPETARLEKLLKLFLDRKLHFAIVVDEYGGTQGMITIENILEELVGQIQDEFDQEKPLLLRTGERTWEAAGTLPLHELEEIVGEPLRQDDITTVSGWLTHRLGGFPKLGEVVAAGDCELRVEQIEGMRVERLKIIKRAGEQNEM